MLNHYEFMDSPLHVCFVPYLYFDVIFAGMSGGIQALLWVVY